MKIRDFYFLPEQFLLGVEVFEGVVFIHLLFFTLEIRIEEGKNDTQS